jgi:hypothetical protein
MAADDGRESARQGNPADFKIAGPAVVCDDPAMLASIGIREILTILVVLAALTIGARMLRRR